MKWTIVNMESFEEELTRLLIDHRTLIETDMRSFERELMKRRDPGLWIEQHGTRISPRYWIVELGGLDLMLELLPDDRLIRLLWPRLHVERVVTEFLLSTTKQFEKQIAELRRQDAVLVDAALSELKRNLQVTPETLGTKIDFGFWSAQQGRLIVIFELDQQEKTIQLLACKLSDSHPGDLHARGVD